MACPSCGCVLYREFGPCEGTTHAAESERLHRTRRDVHLALSKAGVRTHYCIGELAQWPLGREVGAVERTEMLVAEVLQLREDRVRLDHRVKELASALGEASNREDALREELDEASSRAKDIL